MFCLAFYLWEGARFRVSNKAVYVVGSTCLYWAVRGGAISCVEYLASKGMSLVEPLLPDEQCCDEFDQTTTFSLAARCGHAKLLRVLLKRTGYLESGVDAPLVLLMHAIAGGSMDVMRMCVEELGADCNAWVSRPGAPTRTPLLWALHCRKEKCAKHLLEMESVDVHVRDCCGHTALHHAARNNMAHCAMLLLQRGVNPGLRAFEHTAQQLAKREGHTRLAKFLKKKQEQWQRERRRLRNKRRRAKKKGGELEDDGESQQAAQRYCYHKCCGSASTSARKEVPSPPARTTEAEDTELEPQQQEEQQTSEMVVETPTMQVPCEARDPAPELELALVVPEHDPVLDLPLHKMHEVIGWQTGIEVLPPLQTSNTAPVA